MVCGLVMVVSRLTTVLLVGLGSGVTAFDTLPHPLTEAVYSIRKRAPKSRRLSMLSERAAERKAP